MKISVIIPYKNAQKWIKGCAESCLRQEGELEFIFVDDGSKDGGPFLLDEIKDDRFVRIGNHNCAGVSGARNSGLEKATGEWVTFLDVDDELLPEAWKIFGFMTELSDTINVIQANHVCGYVSSDRIRCAVNERGMYGPGDLPKAWCMVWNKLYRRSFLEENQIRFKEGVQYGEDELFNLTCLEYDNRIFHVKRGTRTMIHRSDTPDSLSHRKTPAQLLQQSRELEDFLEQCDNVQIRRAICIMLSDRWQHRLMEVFGK